MEYIILVGGDANKGSREPQHIEQGISNLEGLGWRSNIIAVFS
jgi:hypothetical protein